jgi:hypothetical protein
MSNPLKQIKDILSEPKSIKIGVVMDSTNDRCVVKLSDSNYINVWGNYPKGSNVYIKDGVILGKIKRENINSVRID